MQIHSLFSFNLNFSIFNIVQLKDRLEDIMATYQLFLFFLFVRGMEVGMLCVF